MQQADKFSITLPYTPFAVPAGRDGTTLVNLTPNATRRTAYSTSTYRRRLEAQARNQVKQDTEMLLRSVIGRTEGPYFAPPGGAVVLDIKLTFEVTRKRDRDNIIGGLKEVQDTISEYIRIDDSKFVTRDVVWEKGPSETTTIEVAYELSG